jgi:hypothetical protein
MAANPTLRTIRMVEKVIQNHDDSIITIPQIKELLPRKVNHNILIEVLSYLEENRKIYSSIKGITWTDNTDKRFKEILKSTIPYDKIFPKK